MENLFGGMTMHQDGCVWPHEHIEGQNDPNKVNWEGARQDLGPGEFYDPSDCRRKQNPNWEFPVYTALLYLGGRGAEALDGAEQCSSGMRGGELAFLDRMSNRFNGSSEESWRDHEVTVVEPQCGTLVAFKTGEHGYPGNPHITRSTPLPRAHNPQPAH